MSEADVDLLDPASYRDGPPHALFDQLRQNDPVHWLDELDGPGYWLLTRHRDVLAVSQAWEVFSSEARGSMLYEMDADDLAVHRQLLVGMDPPRHTRYRLLVNRAFTPKAIRALHDDIDRLAGEIVMSAIAKASADERGECDLVADIAARLPVAVVSGILGIPAEDRAHVVGLVSAMMALPQLGAEPTSFNDAMAAVCAYGRGLFAERRRHPADDVAGRLVAAEIDGDRLDDDELEHFLVILVTAATDTTAHGITNGMLALLENPAELARLRGDITLVGPAVEEMLRWGTPTMYFRRTATADAVIGDTRVRRGDKIVMAYTAANRDPDVFADPHRFSIDRDPNPHVSFGAPGPHICLGSGLARAEIAAAVRHLVIDHPGLCIAGSPERLASNMLNGLVRLPIAFGERSR